MEFSCIKAGGALRDVNNKRGLINLSQLSENTIYVIGTIGHLNKRGEVLCKQACIPDSCSWQSEERIYTHIHTPAISLMCKEAWEET